MNKVIFVSGRDHACMITPLDESSWGLEYLLCLKVSPHWLHTTAKEEGTLTKGKSEEIQLN